MPQSVDIRRILSQVPIFTGLTEPEMQFLVQRSVARPYAAGELVFSEGEPCTGLYVVAKGRIRIFKVSPAGREQVLSLDGPGSSVAELPVFDGGNYPASVSAVADSVLIFVSKKDFQALVLQHPEVALKVLKVVGGRLRRLVGLIEELSFTTVRHRLASHLLHLAKSSGEKTPEGIRFELQGSQQDLAAVVGTVRELVSRNLGRLQDEGLIRMDGRTVLVTDINALDAVIRETE